MKVSLGKIADLVQGQTRGDPAKMIRGAAPFEQADDHEITVAGQAKYLKKIDNCKAGVIIVPRNTKVPGRNLIQVDLPMVAFAKVLQFFYPPVQPPEGIHPPG